MPRICYYSAVLTFGVLFSSLHSWGISSFFKVHIDTLIIDSDTIYIERDEISIISDTLSEKSANPIPKNSHPWSASISTGLNLTGARLNANSAEFLPLDDFLGSPYKPMPSMSVGADFGFRFLRLPSNRGTIELSACGGYIQNKIVIGYTGIKDPSELENDSIEFFSADGGILNMGFFVVTGGPGVGEVDTVDISLNSSKISYRTHDVAMKLRATLNLGQRNLRWFAETGVIRRFIEPQTSDETFYFINASGSYQVLESEQVRPGNLLVPHFALGLEKSVETSLVNKDQFFVLGAVFNASLPSSMIYNDEFFSIELRSFSLNAFARFFF